MPQDRLGRRAKSSITIVQLRNVAHSHGEVRALISQGLSKRQIIDLEGFN
jgi:hypothetical protein